MLLHGMSLKKNINTFSSILIVDVIIPCVWIEREKERGESAHQKCRRQTTFHLGI